MAYTKIKDRQLDYKEVTIISKLGTHKKRVREDRVDRYINDYLLFNNLKGTGYLIKDVF